MTAGVERLTSCPLCNGTRSAVLPVPRRRVDHAVFDGIRDSLGLVRCRDCGLVYTNPRPSAERLSAFYSGDGYACHDTDASSSASRKADHLLERVARHLPADAPRTLLEFGAGGGGFLLHARGRGWQVQGYDPARPALDACRGAGIDATDRLEDLPPGRFGVVSLLHVLEHLPDPRQTLAQIHPLLAPRGRLLIEVPNAKSLRARMAAPFLSRRYPVDERYRAFPVHLTYFSGRTLRAILAKTGWITEATFTMGLGVDRFISRPDPPPDRNGTPAQPTQPTTARPHRPCGKRKLRHIARDVFLAAGLGENIAVLARRANDAP